MRISVAFAVLAVALSGCVSSHVIVGQVRPPISPDDVRLYLHPPAGPYEEIALLDTSSRDSFSLTAQAKTNKVLERLRAEAAKLGANGLLLQGVGDQSAGSVSSGFGSATVHGNTAFASGIGFSGNIMVKAGNGMAIYVAPDAVASTH